jgi:hypothetical protein
MWGNQDLNLGPTGYEGGSNLFQPAPSNLKRSLRVKVKNIDL